MRGPPGPPPPRPSRWKRGCRFATPCSHEGLDRRPCAAPKHGGRRSQSHSGRDLDPSRRCRRGRGAISSRGVCLPGAFSWTAGHRRSPSIRRLPGPRRPLLTWAQQLAQSLKVELFLGGFPEALDSARTYNTALHLGRDGRLKAAYRKLHLFSVDLPDGTRLDEGENTGTGEQLVLTESEGFTVGLAICYDLRFPLLFERQRMDGATVLTVPSAFTESTGQAHWHALLRARAIEQQCWLLAAAQCGNHGDGRRSYGHSLVLDPWGRVVLDLGEAPAVGLTTLTESALSRARDALPRPYPPTPPKCFTSRRILLSVFKGEFQRSRAIADPNAPPRAAVFCPSPRLLAARTLRPFPVSEPHP